MNFFKKHKVLLMVMAILAMYLFFPVGKIMNPVQATAPNNFHPQSFGQPWGDHRHRGIDVFAPEGTPIRAAASGLVVWNHIANDGEKYPYQGGNAVDIIGMGGRFYHYSHMSEIIARPGSFVFQGEIIGKVGRTGNASRPGCPAHCHFSIGSAIPHFSNDGMSPFLLDPAKEIDNSL